MWHRAFSLYSSQWSFFEIFATNSSILLRSICSVPLSSARHSLFTQDIGRVIVFSFTLTKHTLYYNVYSDSIYISINATRFKPLHVYLKTANLLLSYFQQMWVSSPMILTSLINSNIAKPQPVVRNCFENVDTSTIFRWKCTKASNVTGSFAISELWRLNRDR